MSNTSSYTIREFKLHKFIYIDHGTKLITLKIIAPHRVVVRAVWVRGGECEVTLTPELALDIARNIQRRALEIKPSLKEDHEDYLKEL